MGHKGKPITVSFPNQSHSQMHSKYLSLYSQIGVVLIHHQRNLFVQQRETHNRYPQLVKRQRTTDHEVQQQTGTYTKQLT